jgi:hypothetical protein
MNCPHCGCEFEPPHTRSSRANSYYWGVVMALISAELGYTPEETHDALKAKFRGREDVTTGLVIARSTKTNSADFWQYVEQVREWSHTFLGVYIPAPNETEVAA